MMQHENDKMSSIRRSKAAHDKKRSEQPRYGGRCSADEKQLITDLLGVTEHKTEKALIFEALRRYKDEIELSAND